MHGLILAGGEGSRLAAELGVPKPLVRVGGETLAVRLLRTLADLGCETLTFMARADRRAVVDALAGLQFGPPLTVQTCLTRSSLHTLVEGLRIVPAGPVFCSMVDSVMPAADWRLVYEASGRALDAGADALLAVTPFVDDESPVYVMVDDNEIVTAVSDQPVVPPRVTGGVYAFGPAARRGAGQAVEERVERMRGFLKWLVARGQRVATVTVSRIIDIDHESDLRLANAWLGSAEARG
ncbi:MAG TPA: NTP transferase domain-containing protein [Gemmatimonadales bacterium]|nr:NTP transferase domain-containing protein [Gemmatimonadales bacterium]